MLARRREQIIVLVGLLGLNLGLAWSLERYWKDYRSRTQWVYAQPAPVTSTSPSELSRAPAAAQSFAEIVNRTIFRPERTNETLTESAKAPELPILYGTMNLGDGLFAMMAPGDQPTALSRPVRTGEEIGGYKLVSIADSQVVLAWGEKEFTISVWESARRVPRIVEKPGPTVRPAASTAPTASTGRVTTVGPSPAPSSISEERKKYTPAGYNALFGAPPDAPAGTVIGGRRKRVERTMFGIDKTWWEDVEQPKNPAQKADEK
jgi:hypothetical protein